MVTKTRNKKKKSTTKKNEKKSTDNKLSLELETWLDSAKEVSKCQTCHNNEAKKITRFLLDAMINRNVRVGLKRLYAKVKEEVPSYKLSFWAWRTHVYKCEASTYDKVRKIEM